MLKNLFKEFENTLYPEYKCLLCGREVFDTATGLCNKCNNELKPISGHVCTKCGMPIGDGIHFCDTCREFKYSFDFARAVFPFDEKSAKLIYDLKFYGKLFVAKYLANFMIKTMEEMNQLVDVIVPVPICEKRRKLRGFNQSEILANELSKLSTVPCDSQALIRVLPTKHTQRGLSKEQRRENLKGAFALGDSPVEGKSILLIDDVFTTGATVNECAKMLKKGKAQSVFVLTVCKTVL